MPPHPMPACLTMGVGGGATRECRGEIERAAVPFASRCRPWYLTALSGRE